MQKGYVLELRMLNAARDDAHLTSLHGGQVLGPRLQAQLQVGRGAGL